MKIYGTEVKGPLIIDKESTLSAWTSADEGRLVYAEDVDKVYYGSNTAWNVWAKDVSDTAYGAGWDGVTDVAPSKNAVYDELQARPRRNAIINGNMRIWQRGTTTLTNPADGAYFPDRFQVTHNLGDGTYNAICEAVTPVAGFPFSNALKIDCTHVETAVAAGEYMFINYKVEGYDFIPFEGNRATLSFWVKATKVGTYCVVFRNNALDKSYIAEYTVNVTNTWEKKIVSLTFNSGGTFLYTNVIGLHISWTVFCGSTYQTTKDTWASGNYIATSNQVNGFDSTDNNFSLTGVQLELGPTATEFECRPFAEELALCQRYYETGHFDWIMYTLAGNGFRARQSYVVTKRAIPTLTISGVTTSNVYLPAITTTINSICPNCAAMASGVVIYVGAFSSSAEL